MYTTEPLSMPHPRNYMLLLVTLPSATEMAVDMLNGQAVWHYEPTDTHKEGFTLFRETKDFGCLTVCIALPAGVNDDHAAIIAHHCKFMVEKNLELAGEPTADPDRYTPLDSYAFREAGADETIEDLLEWSDSVRRKRSGRAYDAMPSDTPTTRVYSDEKLLVNIKDAITAKHLTTLTFTQRTLSDVAPFVRQYIDEFFRSGEGSDLDPTDYEYTWVVVPRRKRGTKG